MSIPSTVSPSMVSPSPRIVDPGPPFDIVRSSPRPPTTVTAFDPLEKPWGPAPSSTIFSSPRSPSFCGAPSSPLGGWTTAVPPCNTRFTVS